MLTDLLVALSSPRPRSLAEIAAELGTTAERLGIALEQCERMGYLDRGDDTCAASACGGCPVPCGVALRATASDRPGAPKGARATLQLAPVWWRLTDRGRRAVALARPSG